MGALEGGPESGEGIMSGHIGTRMTGTRWAGGALAGLLAGGMAIASGTAFASPGATSTGMGGMQMASSSAHHRGTTKGWYDGRTVTFFYSRNFSCKSPPASKASSRCVAGPNYTQTPARDFDPLYVVVPLGFTPPRRTLQCQAGRCIDHPRTIDLSAVLGAGTGNVLLPAHSHIIATSNSHQAEWWNVDVVGVKNLRSWNKIVRAKSDRELQHLQRTDSAEVTGNITTNLFLFFRVLR
jgi:hypothetical protein